MYYFTTIASAMTGGENVGTGSGHKSLAGLEHPPEELHELFSAIKICPKCYKPKQENEWGFTMCRMCESGGRR